MSCFYAIFFGTRCFPQSALAPLFQVLERLQCWTLYVDILILECGGNLYDAVSMAVKAALYSTR